MLTEMVAMLPTPPSQTEKAIAGLHYAYPTIVFFYFVIASTITVCTLQTRRLRAQDQHVRRDIMLTLIFGVTMTYLVEAVTVGIKAWVENLFPEQDHVVYLLASVISFGAQALALTDSKFPVWYPYYGTWLVGLVAEMVLLIVPNILFPPATSSDYVIIVIQSLRVCHFIVLPALYFGLRNDDKEYADSDTERQSLLRKKLAPKSAKDAASKGNGYGGTTDTSSQDDDSADKSSDADSEDSYLASERKAQEKIDKRLAQDGNWFTYAKGFSIFFPYLWPVHDKALQFRAVLVGLCLLSGNAMNLLVPAQTGVVLDSLDKLKDGKNVNIWIPIGVYTLLRFLNGGACIGWLRKWLWLPVEQYSYDALSTASHAHLMSLSSDFHDSKTSSDLTQAVHGGRSVADLLETVCFQVIPMFIDLAVAFAYLWGYYGPYMGLMMAATAITYLYTTTKLYSYRASKRRDYVAIYRKEWTIGQQSLDGWNTASLFNMIPYERHRYACAVKDHMKSKRAFEMSNQFIGAAQALILTLGLCGALWLGGWQVAYRGESVGKFTTLLVYWAQLQSPLTFFATMYRSISYSLMDAERLLELFQTKPTITDLPNAKALKLGKGLVKFDRVSFAYDERKPTLKTVTFEVPPGKTVALVGETGGGKSTILKLIDRFYDVKSGSITIDGQDIRDVTLESLRSKIGVVPQEPMLFNDSIMNNIRYARLSATDPEVYEACRAAAVHDKIMSFPDGYNSKVGDRGVKLSGGEKQRVAIARAILKQPEIILLDEATSAVDTETEQMIQEGFKTLCKGRTTFIVAHRLSTIMKADHILVVMNGEIIEEGSHDDLIHSNGKYHDLWSKQIFVKPTTDRSRSRSPKKQDADIVNDLTPMKQTTELAKVLSTTEHEEPAQIQKDDSKGNTNAEEQKPANGHIREGSRLKPDAPEFIPHQAKSVPDKVATMLKNDSKVQKKLEKEEKKRQEKLEKKAASLAKKEGKKIARKIDRGDASLSTDDSQSAGPSNGQTTEGDLTDKPKARRSRSRRHLARSEPSKSLVSHDGQQDSDVTAVGSGEGQPLLQNNAAQFRRVSAPSETPSGSQETRNTRHRRNRHWRLKNRAAENSRHANSSSLLTSGDPSDDVFMPRPPVSTPVTSIPKLTQTPRVTFAPPKF